MALFLLTMAVVFQLLSGLPVAAHRFLAVLFLLAFLLRTGLAWRDRKTLTKGHLQQGYALAGFLLYTVLKVSWPAFYHALATLSGAFSALVGVIIRKPIAMGITYSGIDLVVLFLIALTVSLLLLGGGSWKTWLLSYGGTLFLWGVYIALWTVLAENSLALGLNLVEPFTGPLDYRFLLFLFLLGFYCLICRGMDVNVAVEGKKTWRTLLPAGLSLLLLALLTLPAFVMKKPVVQTGKQVLFWDTGIDFSVPEQEKYGLDYVGMFGVLPHYLSEQGYLCRMEETLSETTLSGTDILVVINPMRMPSEGERQAVWRFLEEGGSLLAVGDHTGGEQVRFPLDALLEPVGISLNFDSAVPFRTLWADDFVLARHQTMKGISDRQIQMVVGASLKTGTNARPLVIGISGYSDWGDEANVLDGYLGDMHFARGERIGDLVLAAEASYGRGKVLVLGDTTHLQNTVIPYSYPFLDNTFAYLSDNGREAVSAWSPDGFFRATCVVDSSHMEVLNRDKSGGALDGFLACALRAGYLPYLNQTESLISWLEQRPELVLLVEPAKAFSGRELEALTDYMWEGGTLLVCGGYESPKATQTLLSAFGFSFEPMPIGRIAPEQDPEMAFWNACPILYQGAALGESGDVESLMEIWGYSIIARAPVGTGSLYLIADPGFLTNKNLESVDTYRRGNVLFVDRLLDAIVKGEG